MPGLLRALRDRGVLIGVLTNFTRPERQAKLDQCGLSGFVGALVTTLRALGVSAAQAVMVGDSWASDVIGARDAGLRAVWFGRFGGVVALDGVPVLRAVLDA